MYICQEYWKQVQNSPKYYLSSQTHTDNLHCFSSVFKGYDFMASLNLSQNDKLIYLWKSIVIDSFLCMILEIYLRKYSTRINSWFLRDLYNFLKRNQIIVTKQLFLLYKMN